MGYPGAEISLIAYYGKTRFRVGIDIGFGDVVESVEHSIPLMAYSKGVLFEKTIKLSCYPKEFIFAEKLETIIYRGTINSRMKDYHDLYSLIISSQFSSFHNLEGIIRLVFNHRKTPLTLPITDNDLEQLQNFWNRYLKNLQAKNAESLPLTIAQVIATINNWLISNTGLIGSKIVRATHSTK